MLLYYSHFRTYFLLHNKPHTELCISSRNTRLRRDFPRPPGEWRLGPPFPAVFGGGKRKKKLPQGHEDPEYVLSFEIGQRESGFYRERTDRIMPTSSTVL